MIGFGSLILRRRDQPTQNTSYHNGSINIGEVATAQGFVVGDLWDCFGVRHHFAVNGVFLHSRAVIVRLSGLNVVLLMKVREFSSQFRGYTFSICGCTKKKEL
jgi:hypothetical protein